MTRSDDTRPSCVVVTPMAPIPSKGGTYIRVAATVESLASRYRVTVVCTGTPSAVERVQSSEFCARVGAELRIEADSFGRTRRRPLAQRSITVAGAIGARTERLGLDPLPAAIESLLRDADLVWLCRQGPFMNRRLPARLTVPLVVDVDDLEERVIAPGSGADAAQAWLARRKIVLARRRLLGAATTAVVCSDVDAARLVASCPVRVLPNTYPAPAGIDASLAPDVGSPVVTMIGRMGYRPNHDGARWLIERVWPLVHRSRPDATLVLAGPLSETLPCPHPESGVRRLGEVDQVDEVLQAASVVVAPIHSGSGTRVKILEAFAFGKPVVSTTVGAEGIDVVDGRSILLADDPAGFASAVLRLLADASLARSIADGGSSLFADRYSFTRFCSRVLDIAAEATGAPATAGR